MFFFSLQQPISLYGDNVKLVQGYKKKKNMFRVMSANASEFLFEVADEREMVTWLEGLKQNIDLIKYVSTNILNPPPSRPLD